MTFPTLIIPLPRRPGIGHGFLTTYKEEITNNDSVIIRGIEVRPPKAYDRILERRDPDLYAELQLRRSLEPQRQVKHRERQAREANLEAKLRKRDAQ